MRVLATILHPDAGRAEVLGRDVVREPAWLQTFAEHQPVSVTASAVRALTLGGPAAGDVIASIVWSVALIAIFGTISVRLYRRAV